MSDDALQGMVNSLARWRNTWRELGAAAADESLFQRLSACYSEPHRRYHTMHHLHECFAHLDETRASAERPAEVELALWFHDAIYQPAAKDNEERSAIWARDTATSSGLARDAAERVFTLVMATKHNAVPAGADAQLLVDVDLAILGSNPARFDEYEGQVREEYSWVPWPLYRRERRKVLQEFAGRPTIYCTDHFRAACEAQARDNIARSLARL